MSILITGSDQITHFAAVFSNRSLATAMAPALSRREVEALAGLLRALGEMATAELWIRAHTTSGREGDQQRPPAEAYVVPVDPAEELQCDSCQ